MHVGKALGRAAHGVDIARQAHRVGAVNLFQASLFGELHKESRSWRSEPTDEADDVGVPQLKECPDLTLRGAILGGGIVKNLDRHEFIIASPLVNLCYTPRLDQGTKNDFAGSSLKHSPEVKPEMVVMRPVRVVLCVCGVMGSGCDVM